MNDGHCVLAITVAATHAHMLTELPAEMGAVRSIVGDAKNASSRAVRQEMPGRIWAGGGDYRRVSDKRHQQRIFEYIVNHSREGAWVWTVQDG